MKFQANEGGAPPEKREPVRRALAGKPIPSVLHLAGAMESLLAVLCELVDASGRDAADLHNEVRAELDAVWGRKGR